MCGETKTGITLMKMDAGLDTGEILNQAEIDIESADTRETLYKKLYELGAEKLPEWILRATTSLPAQSGDCPYQKQEIASPTPIAWRLSREDGFVSWQSIIANQPIFSSKHLQKALEFSRLSLEEFLSRLPRALAGFPTLWTVVKTTKGEKRMRLLSFEPNSIRPQWVQLEGMGEPSHFKQIKNQLLER
jgi:methionyl-tRNA formyltransferase